MASRTESDLMAQPGELATPGPGPDSGPAPEPRPAKVFNRSSFEGEFLIVIPGQSAEDFERYAPESQFCEYFEGSIYMPSPVADRHQEHTGFLFHLLDGFKWEREGTIGQILMGPAVLRLDEEHKPEPDLFVRPVAGTADAPLALLAVEVLSPSNRGYDLEFKAEFYQQAGLPEVWYLDDRDRALIVDRRTADGYRRERHTEGPLACAMIPGFWIDVAWLWTDPLPNPRRCLETILAGPPV